MSIEVFKFITVGLAGFSFGFILSMVIFKKKNTENALIKLLLDFKKTIEEYKTQNILNTTEVKTALKEASHLSKVLTTNQNLKGKFGEDCLENIIKACYPNLNSDYFKQVETYNSDGVKIKPDYLIKLPNNKNIIIDCKINLEKYIEYKDSLNSNLENITKSNFIKDLNSTINSLSNKKYENAINLLQPDFILMYIPLETVVNQIYTDPDFISVIKNATNKNVIIVGNSSVLTVIKLTRLIWAQEIQNNNIEKIIDCAKNIYTLIAKHSQMLFDLKTALNEHTASFNKEYEKITSNNNLFKYIEQMKNFGLDLDKNNLKRGQKEISVNSEFLK